jgi:hypothetical protein
MDPVAKVGATGIVALWCWIKSLVCRVVGHEERSFVVGSWALGRLIPYHRCNRCWRIVEIPVPPLPESGPFLDCAAYLRSRQGE